MTATTFVCCECRHRIDNPYNQYTERIEYRRVDGLKRAMTRTTRDLCRQCVDRIRERTDNPHGVEQTEMFG